MTCKMILNSAREKICRPLERSARRLIPVLILPLFLVSAFGSNATATTPSDADYLTVRDGHLFRDGKRVRFWGAIGSFPRESHADNIAVVKRLKDMGFNMVRLWTVPASDNYTMGDGSQSDLMDHFLKACKDEGISIWWAGMNGAPGNALPNDVDILNDPKTAKAWQEAVTTADGKGLNMWDTRARIWDKRFELLTIDRLRKAARHVNKYTGLAYADDPMMVIWELGNEEWWFSHAIGGTWKKLPKFFQEELLGQWHDWLRARYKNDAGLSAAWNGLLPGETLGTAQLAPLRDPSVPIILNDANPLAMESLKAVGSTLTRENFTEARGRDVIQFFLDIWIAHKQRLDSEVKKFGKAAQLAPLVWDTGIGYEIQAQYMQQQAGAVAHDSYITGFHHDPAHKRFPWFSGLEELPRLAGGQPWIEQNRVEGKPYLVYETQIEQPAKYRAEFPLRLATLGSIQDWDAVCWHYFGAPPDSTKPQSYDRQMDYTSTEWHHPQGYHYQYDEVQMSAMKAASEIFRTRLLDPARNPTTFIFGRKSLTDPRSMDYGKSYGDAGLRFLSTTYRYGMRLKIDPSREDDEIVGPSYDRGYYEPNPIRPTDNIEYDRQKGHLKLDAPGVASYTGFFAQYGGPVSFKSGVVLRDVRVENPPGMAYPVGEDEKYVEFTLASADGLPLAQTKKAVLSVVSTSFNSGFKLDESRIRNAFLWSANKGATVSIGDPGGKPLVARVDAVIDLPLFDGADYRFLDWNYDEIARGKITNGTLRIPADKPVFITEIMR